jgi:hypothetical protein
MANGDAEINVAQSTFRDPGYTLLSYNPEPRRDHVRAIVTIALVVAFLALLTDACVAALATPEHWTQTKENAANPSARAHGLAGLRSRILFRD